MCGFLDCPTVADTCYVLPLVHILMFLYLSCLLSLLLGSMLSIIAEDSSEVTWNRNIYSWSSPYNFPTCFFQLNILIQHRKFLFIFSYFLKFFFHSIFLPSVQRKWLFHHHCLCLIHDIDFTTQAASCLIKKTLFSV